MESFQLFRLEWFVKRAFGGCLNVLRLNPKDIKFDRS